MSSVAVVCFLFFTEDPYPSSSIDLKCKERVTDSDSEHGSGDESERKVTSFSLTIIYHLNGFGLFEVGFYEIPIHNQCITYISWQSPHPQFMRTIPAQKLSNMLLWTRSAATVY